jgi:butyryl-CoA dehydrogenase
MGDLGLFGLVVDEQYGGSAGAGGDFTSLCVAIEELGRVDQSIGVTLEAGVGLGINPILAYGTDEQRQRWLPGLASGKKLGCFALSEPDAGSDAAAQKTTATASGAGWVLNGTKNFITNGPVSDVIIVFAMTDAASGTRGISAFVVASDAPGVKFGPADDKMGIRGAPSSQIFFTECALPGDAMLGAPGDGFKIAMRTLDGGRIGIGAQAVGIARAAFEDATHYALERKTFGQPISEHQAIQFKLADMCTEIDAARLLVWRAAVKKDAGLRHTTESSMAKLFASEVANRAAKEAVQVFGGYGYLTDFPVERHFRDAKITEIYEGTSEIQRLVIASALLKD